MMKKKKKKNMAWCGGESRCLLSTMKAWEEEDGRTDKQIFID